MPTWTGVSTLSVVLESGYQNCDIYANGQNRIAVTVSIQPTDEDAEVIWVDPGHLLSRMWLIDYVDESTLSWKSGSSWSYTDSANQFTAIPGSTDSDSAPDSVSEERAVVSTTENGIQQITFYVYCGSGVANPKSIGVLVRTDTDDSVTSSLNGTFHDKVTLKPRSAVVYRRGDVSWEYARTTTKYGGNTKYVTTDAWNYYLSLDSRDNHFVTFKVWNCFSQSGYQGFFSSHIPSDNHRKNFYGGYVWNQEPHDSAYYVPSDGHSLGEVVNFPDGNKWWDYARIYDRSYPERYLCFTWVHSTTGGDGWHLPNGPLTDWGEWYTLEIAAYDRYGNRSEFWVDGSDIIGGLNLYDTRP
ncbi:hypothetical protein ACFVUH_13345 [Kitasatospora sp. NPDC058032]|uniref:hypothetical protein n=1 Tax=Kitasatospora sp. NPDC058032 TaxID=3346307 RepID=UPI0036D9F39B